MALIKCAECGKEISSLATACPHCGCPREFQAEATGLNTQSTSTEVREIDPIWNEAMESVLSGSKLGGINIIRNATGISLHEAYTIVNYISEHKKLPDDLPGIMGVSSQKGYQEFQPIISICDFCDRLISPRAEICPHCGHQTGVHVCPRCNSIDTEVFSGTDKAISILLFGKRAARNVMSKYWCRDCGYKF